MRFGGWPRPCGGGRGNRIRRPAIARRVRFFRAGQERAGLCDEKRMTQCVVAPLGLAHLSPIGARLDQSAPGPPGLRHALA